LLKVEELRADLVAAGVADDRARVIPLAHGRIPLEAQTQLAADGLDFVAGKTDAALTDVVSVAAVAGRSGAIADHDGRVEARISPAIGRVRRFCRVKLHNTPQGWIRER